ncbi:unconventional myosin-IXb-like [Halichondria panicea]|uniref:unconventional myosin-IXb-like n=1 Tax=Halichondria panicea TaxID=6063 RepID=UPI00312B90B5
MSDSQFFDLADLNGPLTVEAILQTLQQRFINRQCYTWVGPVLLAVNSFEAPSPTTHAVLKRLVENVLSELSSKPRALLFNGLSGAGKTFTADQVLLKMFQTAHKSDWLQNLRKYWQVSSVVLKALGSAATAGNKESSRIGRMVDFGFAGQIITKVKINCFFLDQTRVVGTKQSEQNFHIFYQLLAGLTPEERNKLALSYHEPRTLHYLSQGLEPRESQQVLANHFEAWKSSLAQLGIPLTDVVKVLVAVLLLGNVLFYEAKNQELSMQGADELGAVAGLLGVQPQQLQQGLTLRTYASERGEAVQAPCSAAASNGARDALAKSLYIRTIVAILRRINTLLRGAAQRSQGSQPPPPDDATLHVVDMFGFENAEVNSLEALCGNLVSESLQDYYTRSLFRATVDQCNAEGVDPLFESSLYDHTPCLTLLGGGVGGSHTLTHLINQETLSPRVSSEDIRVRLRARFHTNKSFLPPGGSSSTFAIRHFAGDVVYDIYSLLNANADTIADDIVATFNTKECNFGFVAHLFAVELNRDLHSDGTPKGQMCRLTPAYLQHSPHESKPPTTFIQDFQANFKDALTVLNSCQPFFVRCIKSNPDQTPGQFDRDYVSGQIQTLAVFETVDLVQTGFLHFMSFDDFIGKYCTLVPDYVPLPNMHPAEVLEGMLAALSRVLEEVELSQEHYAIGNTQIFLNEELFRCLEHMRLLILNRAAVRIQAAVRRFLCRQHWPQLMVSLRAARLQGEAQTKLTKTVPPVAPNGEKVYTVRNYTIVGSYKVGFPQWRVMKCCYPEGGLLRPGDEVYVLGRSHKRGYLIVEHQGAQIHMPHQYTELRLTPPNSPSTSRPPRMSRDKPTYSDL